MGRADLLCGFLSVIALSLSITATRAPGNASRGDKRFHGDENSDAAGGVIVTTPALCSGVVGERPPTHEMLCQADATEETRTTAVPEPPEHREEVVAAAIVAQEEILPVAATDISTTVSDETAVTIPTSALEETMGCVSSDEVRRGKQGNEEDEEQMQEGEEGKRRKGTTGDGTTAPGRGAAGTAPSPPPSRRPDAATAVAARVHPEERPPPEKVGAAVGGEKDTGPGLSRFCAALLFAAGATLCKEVGVTVFGLMAGGEVVRFFEERDWRQRQRQRQRQRRQRGPRSAEPTAENHEMSRGIAVRGRWSCRFKTRVPLAAAARAASAAVGAATMVALHVRLHGGAGVREWGVLENDISILARWVPGVALTACAPQTGVENFHETT